jgi:multidrug efflux pump subunit AcrA (membrane-fusion protein)
MTYQQASPIIYAPITGTITGLSLQTGTIIASSQSSTGTATSTKIANITTAAKPNITLNLTEIDIPKIKVGDKATITFDAIPDKTFTGKVISIDKVGVISSNVTNYPTVLALDTNDPGILPNMAASASIITQTKDNVLMVPTTAIVNQNGQSQVRILNNNQLEFINVQTGLTSDTQIEILSGVTEGQSVVTSIITPSTSTSTTSPFSGFNRGFGGGGGGNAVRVNR